MSNEFCEKACPAQIYCDSIEQKALKFRRLLTNVELITMDLDPIDETKTVNEPSSVQDHVAQGLITQWYGDVLVDLEKHAKLETVEDNEEALLELWEPYINELYKKADEAGIDIDAMQADVSRYIAYSQMALQGIDNVNEYSEQQAQELEDLAVRVKEYFDLAITRQTCVSGPQPANDYEGNMVMQCSSPNLSDIQKAKSSQLL